MEIHEIEIRNMIEKISKTISCFLKDKIDKPKGKKTGMKSEMKEETIQMMPQSHTGS